jgi:hypothetical protein
MSVVTLGHGPRVLPRRRFAPRYTLGYILFVFASSVLLVRPMELVTSLTESHLYQWFIAASLLASLPVVFMQFGWTSLQHRPITLCVLGLFFCIMFSQLARAEVERAFESGYEFAKMVAYYLLLVGLVTTPGRLRSFLRWLVLCVGILAVVSILQYHEVIDNPNVKSSVIDRQVKEETNEEIIFKRLQGTGIFKDPNDLSLILVPGMILCIYWLFDPRTRTFKAFWLAPLGLFGYALHLTHSRGGLLALMMALLVLFHARFGRWKTLLAAAIMVPAVLFLYAGRQTELSATEGTGQQRLQIWSDGLYWFRTNPLFGVGEGQYVELVNKVAHNSYLQYYTELGMVGGTFFLAATLLGIWAIYRLGKPPIQIVNPELRRFRPYLLASLAGYATGMMSLTANSYVTTYMMFGLATAYLNITPTWPRVSLLRINGTLIGRVAAVSVVFLVGLYVFVRAFVTY